MGSQLNHLLLSKLLIQDLNKLKITCADGGGDFKLIVNLNVIEFLFFFFARF